MGVEGYRLDGRKDGWISRCLGQGDASQVGVGVEDEGGRGVDFRGLGSAMFVVSTDPMCWRDARKGRRKLQRYKISPNRERERKKETDWKAGSFTCGYVEIGCIAR